MTLTVNMIDDASLVVDSLPNHTDRITVRKVIIDYRYVAEQNEAWLKLFNEIATELECIPERAYILKAIKELKQ